MNDQETLHHFFEAIVGFMSGEGGDGSVLVIIKHPDYGRFDKIVNLFDEWKEKGDFSRFLKRSDPLTHSFRMTSFSYLQEGIIFTTQERAAFVGQEFMYEYIMEI